MLVIGLTGGIGTGKSTVAALLASLGAAVIDADQLVHEGYAQDEPLRQAIVDAFGMDVLDADGSIDRRTLGQRVFQQPEALQRLNGIVHPWVYGRIQERLAALDAAGTAVVAAGGAAAAWRRDTVRWRTQCGSPTLRLRR